VRGIKALVLAIALIAGVAPASAVACDEAAATARTEKLRALLDGQARNARRWNLGWGIGFGVAALGQFGLAYAEYTPLGEYTEDTEAGLYVAGTKAALASLSHVILPLKIVRVPAATGDPCADVEAAERALRLTGKRERQSFFLNHAGALAANLAGLILLATVFDTWHEAWVGAAMGYPIGLIHAYTQPRRGWHWWRNAPAVTVVHNEQMTGLALGGAF